MSVLINEDITRGKLLAIFKRTAFFRDAESIVYARKVTEPTHVQSGDGIIEAQQGQVVLLGKDGIARVVDERFIEKTYRFVTEDKIPPNFGMRLDNLKMRLGVTH